VTDDFGGDAMTIKRNGGGHRFSVPHQLVDHLSFKLA